MKQLEFKKLTINDNGEAVVDEQGKQLFEMEQLFIDIGEQKTAVQVKDFMDTETYFQITMMSDENQGLQMKKQGYFMMKQLVINPKIDDALIDKLPWNLSMKVMKALRELFMPEDSFLELGVQLDELSPK